jgi:hypothetical protein
MPSLPKPGWAPRARRFAPVLLSRLLGFCALAGLLCGGAPGRLPAAPAPAQPDEPRIVNIYNFIRNSDFRLANSEELMFDCTRHQIELLKRLDLPATWALQYDALINPRYQKLLKEQLGTNDEIAAWWEIPQPLAEKAGVKWRGEHSWDPRAHVGFSPGYTPAERRRLVDVYMADFKAIFGHYPRTAGSWYLDEVTLAYMAKQYGLVASCNCRDQIGTDFYTLWGGYWGPAYYPSRLNAYMPAQTRRGQIPVPVFRMLGSDPIYQHGTTPGLVTLEPVYNSDGGGGGDPKWVDWFMDNLIRQPSLAFAYAQAGQENSFTWAPMQKGLAYQFPRFAQLAKAGQIRVETLEQSGRWFQKKFSLTPATAIVALDDWKGEGRKTVWYDSRFYRLNLLWEKDAFFIRDLHCFNENVVSPTHDTRLEHTSLVYETLPVVDWARWSDGGRQPAGMFPKLIQPDGTAQPLQPDGAPVVTESKRTALQVEQPLRGGGTCSIQCDETKVVFAAVDAHGQPLPWAWDIVGGDCLKAIVKHVEPGRIACRYQGTDYTVKLGARAGIARQLPDGSLRLLPNAAGKLVLELTP